ncbi:hypothetical protein BSK59_15800 [Paenibacillus odorifer]|uniref:hypothetical protein n=1 Tax=Paenibacillus odorifer TaxID=189426 RepID=UPI00096E000E|nr:hypothetical protein [Paenibacillus odorifer]OME54044.1 hypothetical protein BSK59_15800 [Paenibacillus odorifer]
METPLFEREMLFHFEDENKLHAKQCEIIKSLETLGLKYQIKRKSQCGTNTPTWIVSVYK